jgi:capsule polysaccharide modification protein KpsS
MHGTYLYIPRRKIRVRLTCSIATLENEATWVKFQARYSRCYAIKVYAGGVNAVSGLPSITAAPPGQQDYVVIPEQRWLDDIAVKAGLVRQFVAVPLWKNRTVEGQIT